ncbi:DUF4834 family protein [Mariniphaga sediminis]|jgi:membrane-anchored glycerophosphoryl diester phosphodiesterase (GDPDase)|uniref:DUF4834 family protein n=1 Tax=Mariniphaga sediminis TaxID=1628158 RepID=A0A399CZ62_9BACT|nr:DUF4834 family protein [Mariniphaga sediminis]RIH64617.1 DUF4834 family protein [Mariniphaga sediminis]
MNLFIILYLVGFIRTLVVIAIIYFVIRLFTRYVLPVILENKLKDIQHKMNENQNQQQPAKKREGDVTIEYDRKRNGNRSKSEGEYVDFEEVD